MDSVSVGLGGRSAPQVLNYEGREYKFNALVQLRKSAFERVLVDRAKSFCSTDSERAAVVERAAQGAYSFFGPAGQAFRGTFEGGVALVSILAGVTADEAEGLMLGAPGEVAAIVDLVVLESLPRNRREAVLAERKAARERAEAEAKAKAEAGSQGQAAQQEAGEEAPLPR